jgi:hypothetical protein
MHYPEQVLAVFNPDFGYQSKTVGIITIRLGALSRAKPRNAVGIKESLDQQRDCHSAKRSRFVEAAHRNREKAWGDIGSGWISVGHSPIFC